MVDRCWLGIVVAGILAGVASGAGEPNVPSHEKRSGWEALNLIKTTISGTTVYYEKALEPNLPVFERELKRILAGRDKRSSLISRRGEIVADINRILGVTDPNLTEQEKGFSQIAGMLSQTRLTLYFARTTTIKDYLRTGGHLPSFSYDRQADVVTYAPNVRVEAGQRPPETYDLCIPIRPDESFVRDVSETLNAAQVFLGSGFEEVAIHEVTEMTLLKRARPTDPYWRWFSDGFANAITERLVEKYEGKEAAAEFAKGYDPNSYRDEEHRINLRYWMLANHLPYVTEVPVESESRILHARYAYALLEARRVIDTNGIDCVRRILDKVAARDSRTGDDLLEVIKEVTGQDLAARLAHY